MPLGHARARRLEILAGTIPGSVNTVLFTTCRWRSTARRRGVSGISSGNVGDGRRGGDCGQWELRRIPGPRSFPSISRTSRWASPGPSPPPRISRTRSARSRGSTLRRYGAARRFVYLENQYLTSSAVGDVLAQRLAEREGPEVVLVLPYGCSGWLEEATMGVLRARLLRRLRAADRQRSPSRVPSAASGGRRPRTSPSTPRSRSSMIAFSGSDRRTWRNRSMGLGHGVRPRHRVSPSNDRSVAEAMRWIPAHGSWLNTSAAIPRTWSGLCPARIH